ncbi:UDP-N-acetylmuramate dehydrogenase [Neochlamydia sp. S13]|uniref:UDP-N-acetylmuramate dehydrogenase n=1 Tax=Neochlamydia sp. S13 TaxID=1353976 RepID=UPI0005AAF3FD|nr:UDP-N-acetylmuramate dehydrogenase [Neochlamydia sp. S13]BBI17519.1 UDP-N-acetylenolpyruvoylglucosamine reductase [Neochlamydia sp. S13]
MNDDKLSSKLQNNKLLKSVCTFGIGGAAQYYREVHTIEEMQTTLIYCHTRRLPFFILGKGSNCLFDDRGFAGLVIHNKIDFKHQQPEGIFHVGAGYNFSLLGSQTAREGWSGLEFASGIPGSVGGAVYMNAGANGKETHDSLKSVDFINQQGELKTFCKEELTYAYRTSIFQSIRGAIVGATFQLTPSTQARQKQIEIISYRKQTQPYSNKSAGCIFRNPDCHYAGALIEKAGLKGIHVGGAKVSEIHANFIVNTDNATSQEVLKLIEHIKEQVKIHCKVELESEVRYIPYEVERA